MTKFESKKVKPDWEAISTWEEDNKALVMWVITTDCLRDRMVETGQSFRMSSVTIPVEGGTWKLSRMLSKTLLLKDSKKKSLCKTQRTL
jgi:hypothetical protein